MVTEQRRASKKKGPRGDQRWTILFIGDRGKTITFNRLREAIIAILLVFLAFAGLSGWFYHLYSGARTETTVLEKKIENLKQAIASLRNEKDILTARLVVAESRVDEVYSKAKNEAAGKKPPLSKPARQPVRTVTPRGDLTETPPSVTAEKFIVYQEPDAGALRVEYRIVNTGSKDQPVSGRTVVILKGDPDDQRKWLVLPSVPLTSGKPVGEGGRSFSIYNYRTMRFKLNNEKGPDQYKTGTVFVFTPSGDLLLEKEFPVGLAASDSSY
jgi:hypothetical protein